jgi:dihydroorotate dehydrogenase (fumarate)
MDLTTIYMGLTLRSPLVASASPLSEAIDNIRRMEKAGAAAVVLPSMFEEQLRERSSSSDLEQMPQQVVNYVSEGLHFNPENYLEHIRLYRK